MKKKILKKLNRRIARSNAVFDGLDKAGKRVYIAKDVLKQLASRRIKATPGTYFAANVKLDLRTEVDDYGNKDKVIDEEMEMQKAVQGMKSCNACALGSVFACAVGNADDLKLEELGLDTDFDGSSPKVRLKLYGCDMYQYLGRFFTEKQLGLIESAFECRKMSPTYGDAVFQRAADFGTNFKKSKDRMVAIMNNIIENKGTFKPPMMPRQEDCEIG